MSACGEGSDQELRLDKSSSMTSCLSPVAEYCDLVLVYGHGWGGSY